MKLHGNAPFGPKGRLTMVRRVTEEEWSLTEAAEAAGMSERTARKWVDRYLSEGEAGLVDRGSAPHSVPGRTPEDRVEAIAALRRVRMTAAEIAECLGMASPRSPPSSPGSASATQPPRAAGAAQPLRAQASGRADPHRRQEARPHRHKRPRAPGPRHPQGNPLARRRLGVLPRLRRRRHPLGLRRGARRREGEDGDRLPAPPWPSTPPTGSRSRG